jgi:hypothetical protein
MNILELARECNIALFRHNNNDQVATHEDVEDLYKAILQQGRDSMQLEMSQQEPVAYESMVYTELPALIIRPQPPQTNKKGSSK